MRYHIRIANAAERDLLVLHAYIALESPVLADRFLERLTEAIDSLEWFPLRHRRAEESAWLGGLVRAMPVASYRVLYRVRGRIVDVLRIRHAARLRDERAEGPR